MYANTWAQRKRAEIIAREDQQWKQQMKDLSRTTREQIIVIADAHDLRISDLDLYMMKRFKHK